MTIRLLPETLANRIAAGEVVERPASVVKELVENALDAGAQRIEVTLEGGGLHLIRISDDGHGMKDGELALAVERHATSKLANDDLSDIRFFGFRGEALPSIGSVARLTLTSRTANASSAFALVVEHGLKGDVKPAALNGGTRIDVEQLFARLPARLKFMKSERAEEMAVMDIMKRIAVANPTVSFTIVLGSRTVRYAAQPFGTGGANARLGDVLGREFAQNSVAVEATREGFSLSGFAGLPTFHRPTGALQLFMVNNRPVKDRLLAGALRAAYADLMPRDRHPVVALNLSVDPRDVDVNVHPAKAEVRFRDAGHIRALLISALKEALTGNGLRVSNEGAAFAVSAFQEGAASYSFPAPHRAQPRFSFNSPLPARAASAAGQQRFSTAPSADARAGDMPAEAADDAPLGAAKAQLHDTYILTQTADGIALVDMHAAHERLVYEQLKRQRGQGGVPTQALLVPEVVELGVNEAALLAGHEKALAQMGLHVENFGPGAVLVRETPAALGTFPVAALVRDIADALGEWGEALPLAERLDHLAATLACHNSIRAGRRLKPEEMNALLRQIEAEPLAAQCNHGRPTFVTLSKHDLEKLFARR
jgi:DNA mismatch repair protein MutL